MIVWLVVALLLSAADIASAGQVRVVRYGDDRLAGITQVDTVVTTTGDTARCSLDRARMQQVAVETLRATKLPATVSEKTSSWFYSVLITAQTASVGDSCVTAVATELIAHVQGIPEADRDAAAGAWGSLLVGQLSLIRETAMVTSRLKDHTIQVRTTLREQLAAIGERIRAANR